MRPFGREDRLIDRPTILVKTPNLHDGQQSKPCLKTPPRQPAYRKERSHRDFVANLPLERQQLITAVDAAFPTVGELLDAPVTH